MKLQALLSMLGAGLGVMGATTSGSPVLGHIVGQAGPLPPGLTELLTNPGQWVISVVNAVLVNAGEKATSDAVGFMNWVLGSSNVITQTPPALSYGNEAVVRLRDGVAAIANVGLAVVTVWGGVTMIVQPRARAPYHGALELIPRVLLSAILINTSLGWGRFVIDLNNALCAAWGSTPIPAWNLALQPSGGSLLLNLIALAMYAVMGLLLLVQMLMRLALIDALLVIGPLALLCWVLPQTYTWARLWLNTFFGTVFVQAIQVLVLQLGAQLIGGVPRLLPAVGSDPANAGHPWLVTVLLAIAVLQLARKIPGLMPGYPGSGLSGTPTLGTLRLVSSVVRGTAIGRGGR